MFEEPGDAVFARVDNRGVSDGWVIREPSDWYVALSLVVFFLSLFAHVIELATTRREHDATVSAGFVSRKKGRVEVESLALNLVRERLNVVAAGELAELHGV